MAGKFALALIFTTSKLFLSGVAQHCETEDGVPVACGAEDGVPGSTLLTRKTSHARTIASERANKTKWFWGCPPQSDVSEDYPPWQDMQLRIGRNGAECEACGTRHAQAGVLESGWNCKYYWGWGYYLERDGTDKHMNAQSAQKTWNISHDASTFPLIVGTGTADSGLPESLRGVFWLTKQDVSSALMSFGGPNADGGWADTGHLVGYRYRVRVPGDRSWSFAGDRMAGVVSSANLVYDFIFDDMQNPKNAHIHPTALSGWFQFTVSHEWALDFDMHLQTTASGEIDLTHEDYPGSVVWLRKSYLVGIEVTSKRYDLVQVMDEDGNRIQPAWDKFVEYQQTAPRDGQIRYWSSV